VVEPQVGFSQPSSSTDFQFLGAQRKRRIHVDELLWVSRESYLGTFGVSVPHGMKGEEIPAVSGIGSLSFRDTAASWQGVIGGGRQWLIEGTPLGRYAIGSTLRQDNGAFSFELGNRQIFDCTVSGRISAQLAKWNGIVQRQQVYDVTSGEYIFNFTYKGTPVYTDSGYSGNGSCHIAARKDFGNISTGINTNGGVFVAGTKPFGDAGVWLSWYSPGIALDVDAGIASAQPDIRGFPAKEYAERITHVSQGDASVRWQALPGLSLNLEAFVKYRDHQPQKSLLVELPVWDPALGASLTATGASFIADAGGNGPFRAWTMLYYNYSFLTDTGGKRAVSWNSPWTWRTIASASILKRRFFFMLISEMADGMAFPLIEQRMDSTLYWTRKLEHGPVSYELDGRVEYRSPIGRWERNVAQFDVYIEAKRMWSGFMDNTGTISSANLPFYYLVNAPQAYNLGLDVTLGARIHVRL
jgi:hypothetical protein